MSTSDENTTSDTAVTAESTTPLFSELPLAPAVLKAVQDVGYETPSPIQAQSIPHLLEGKDLLGLAQTGTGKTAAFALPLLSRIDINRAEPQVLVLAPTRELAIQVAEAFQRYARHLKDFHVLPIYGGQDMRAQLRGLRRGAHVIVGTPGRVMDHLRRESLNLNSLKTVVLDEADEMLRMGFVDDIEWILDHTPQERQVALFSATMPRDIRRIADTHLNDPARVEIKSKTATVDTITQKVWIGSGGHKLEALTRILEVENFDAMIIFVRTRTATTELAEKLEARGFAAAALNGDMGQAHREKVIDRLKRGSLDIAVATDVAARGLDVERMSHVVNYDIPNDTEAYVHRIGRTGRAGRQGTAILFAAPRERRMLFSIERATRQKIEQMKLPTLKDVRDIRISQFKEQITETVENEDLDIFREVVANLMAEKDLEINDVAAALCYLAQKERPFPDDKRPDPLERTERDRRERRERGERGERPRRDRNERSNEGMTRYRIDMGRDQNITPGDIVGAIANEGKISGSSIGHIRLFDRFSTVYLPDGLTGDTLELLKGAKIRNRSMGLRPYEERAGERGERGNGGRRHSDRRRSNDRGGERRGNDRGERRSAPRRPRAEQE